MKNRILYTLFLFLISNYTFTQVKPYLQPNSMNNNVFTNILYTEQKSNVIDLKIKNRYDRIIIDLGDKDYYRFEIISNQLKK